MTSYPIHTIESAPEGSKQSLETLYKAFGLIPNLAATMADSPALVSTFVAAFGNFGGTAFTGAERQVLLLSNAVANRSTWPVAFHSTLALKEGVSRSDVHAIRDGRTPADPRFAALSTVTRRLIETRGHIDDASLTSGLTELELLDIITGVAISTMANYTANVANPPLEPPFQPEAWS